MRKNSVRKFIHAVIDVLPLLVIPIFALNILHKEVEPISVEAQEQMSVDFNQLITTSDMFSISREDFSLSFDEEEINVVGTTLTRVDTAFIRDRVQLIQGNVYYLKCDLEGVSSSLSSGYCIYFTNGSTFLNSTRFTSVNNNYLRVYYNQNIDITIDETFTIQLFNFTQMFGVGNEPTIQEFNSMFPNEYYDYTISKKILIDKPTITAFNNTDIGSQFVYAMYKPVNDYFNFNNLFNMGAIYDWVQLNLFGGTAPLPVFIIWNIIVYEFFVDLLFLFYAVFMFVIDFAEKCLDRPFRRM